MPIKGESISQDCWFNVKSKTTLHVHVG